jgi:predicted transposase YdaD
VGEMCNLSQGIKEQGIAIGQARGESLIIRKMYKNGFTIQQIAQATEKDIEEIERIVEIDDAHDDIEVINNL